MKATITGTERRRFDSSQQEAYLTLWRTYDRLRAIEDEFFARYELSAQQYNVLRLLEADAPEPTPTLKLVERLISRAPDITRILDKLENRRLIRRTRSRIDRRAVLVNITEQGLTLLGQMTDPLAECHDRQLGHMSEASLAKLVRLLRSASAPHETPESGW